MRGVQKGTCVEDEKGNSHRQRFTKLAFFNFFLWFRRRYKQHSKNKIKIAVPDMTPTFMKIPLKADTWSEAEEGSDWEHSDEKFIHSLLNFSSIPPSCIFTKLKKQRIPRLNPFCD